jgi:hypothetical protein
MRVDAEFAGGNIVVERATEEQLWLRQDLRDTEGDWFYWAFRLRGAAGRTLKVNFTGSNPLTSLGPALSADGGASWHWLGPAAVRGQSFDVTVPLGCDELRLAMTVPYVAADWQRFLASEGLRGGTLCHTPAGRICPTLRLGCLDRQPQQRVLLTCRHHCCEAMASFVLEGFVQMVRRDPWWAETTEVLALPLMDADGVEAGDQGKNRRPHDHNRDYGLRPLYAETRALMDLAPGWSDGKLRLALDLHCPWIRGQGNEHIYFVGPPDAANWRAVQDLASHLADANDGALPYDDARGLPFGQGWNTAASFADGLSCSRWLATLPGVRAAASLEFPYAVADGVEATPARARAFGGALARAVRSWLRA